MKNTILKSTLVFMLCIGLTACSSAPRERHYEVVEDWKPRGDIVGEVVDVMRAPKKCKNSVSSEGGNVFLGSLFGGVIGNQIGKGTGKKVNTVAGVLLGGAIANAHNRENRGKVECESRGYLMTVAYIDNYGQIRYHSMRSDKKERIGNQLYFRL